MKTIANHGRLRFVAAAAAALTLGAVLASAGLAGLYGSASGAAAAKQYPGKKVTVCHRTHSKKHPWVKIRVSANGARAHLRRHHGDFLVDAQHPCPPPSVSSAKQGKHGKHGKGKGKHGSAGAKKQHGNSGGKHGKK